MNLKSVGEIREALERDTVLETTLKTETFGPRLREALDQHFPQGAHRVFFDNADLYSLAALCANDVIPDHTTMNNDDHVFMTLVARRVLAVIGLSEDLPF